VKKKGAKKKEHGGLQRKNFAIEEGVGKERKEGLEDEGGIISLNL